MVTIHVRARDGDEKTIEGVVGAPLMEPLRDADLVDAVCGGVASCGTCHIYAGEEWIDKLGDKTEDEGYMLESLSAVTDVKNTSRLACQVTVTAAMDGLTLEVAPDD